MSACLPVERELLSARWEKQRPLVLVFFFFTTLHLESFGQFQIDCVQCSTVLLINWYSTSESTGIFKIKITSADNEIQGSAGIKQTKVITVRSLFQHRQWKNKKPYSYSVRFMKIHLNSHKMKLWKNDFNIFNSCLSSAKILYFYKLKLKFRLIICLVVEITSPIVNLTRKKILKYHEGRRTMMHKSSLLLNI